MAFTADSTIVDILKKEGAKAILEKYAQRPVNPAQSQILGATVRQIAQYISWDQAKIEVVLKELNAL